MIFILAIAACAALLCWMLFEAHSSRVIHKTILLDTLPMAFDGKKIFFISDIHRRTISPALHGALKQADWIVIGGDMLERGVPVERIRKNANTLKQFGSVLFVFGNNDYDMNKKELKMMLREEGITVLENSSVKVEADGQTLCFAGTDDYAAGNPDLEAALKEKEDCTILLVHNPDLVYGASPSQVTMVSLILTGHTHGGQIRFGPFGIRQKGGWYTLHGVPLLISNGYGATHIPLRLCAKSQTHLITLKAKSLH